MQLPPPDKSALKAGFTLIEMSIVLVIIGLIVGGIVVGQDLIHTAEVKKQIKQIQDVETQITTFRTKYNCLPGDCLNATDFFGTTDSGGHPIVNGDGDGNILATVAYVAPECLSGAIYGSEVSQVFLQLTDASLGNYSVNGTSKVVVQGFPATVLRPRMGMLVTCTGGTLVPATFRQGNSIVLGVGSCDSPEAVSDRIHYRIETTSDYQGPISTDRAMPVADMKAIDEKIDDGNPTGGKFGVLSGCVAGTSSYTPAATTCTLFGNILPSDVVSVGKRLDN